MADSSAQSSSRSTDRSTPVNDLSPSSSICKIKLKRPVNLVKKKKRIRETVFAKAKKEDSSSSVTGATDTTSDTEGVGHFVDLPVPLMCS